MAILLLGITMILWAISGLGWVAISATVIFILALITGILFVVEAVGVAIPAVPIRRQQ